MSWIRISLAFFMVICSVLISHRWIYLSNVCPRLNELHQVPSTWWAICLISVPASGVGMGLYVAGWLELIAVFVFVAAVLSASWGLGSVLTLPPAALAVTASGIFLSLALGHLLAWVWRRTSGHRPMPVVGFLVAGAGAAIALAGTEQFISASSPNSFPPGAASRKSQSHIDAVSPSLVGQSDVTIIREGACIEKRVRNAEFLVIDDVVINQKSVVMSGCIEGTMAQLNAAAVSVDEPFSSPLWEVSVEADEGVVRDSVLGPVYVTTRKGCCADADLTTYFAARSGKRLLVANAVLERRRADLPGGAPGGRDFLATFASCDDAPVPIAECETRSDVHGIIAIGQPRRLEHFLLLDGTANADYACEEVCIDDDDAGADDAFTVNLFDRGNGRKIVIAAARTDSPHVLNGTAVSIVPLSPM